MPRLFTVDEADALLPQLIPLVTRMQEIKRNHDKARQAVGDLNRQAKTNGHGVRSDIQATTQDIESTANELNDVVKEIASTGCEVKDLELGLLDFRCELDGREVYLCWKLGEPRIEWWHELDSGFASRQRILRMD